jgi:CelD/BcsL family acetyltransferase involved in cellulose biosynthesis
MKIKVYSEFNDRLENIWKKFEKDATMTPFQSWVWLSNWYKTVGHPLLSVTPQVVHIYNHEETIAIIPFSIRKKFGAKLLEWMGGINTDYMGPLLHSEFENKDGINDLWSKIRNKLNKYDALHLQKQVESTKTFLYQIGFEDKINQYLKAYKVALPDDWETYYNGLKKGLRSDSRRQMRRIKELGTLDIVIQNDLKVKNEIIKTMITQKRRRYQETGVSDFLSLGEYRNFYKGLASIPQGELNIHCSSLILDGARVATHVGFVDKTTFFYLMPTYEGGEWEKYSPGRLLLIELFKWAINNNFKFFDFTIGGEVYKKDWCNIETCLYESKKVATLIGIFYIFIISLKSILLNTKFFSKTIKFIRK